MVNLLVRKFRARYPSLEIRNKYHDALHVYLGFNLTPKEELALGVVTLCYLVKEFYNKCLLREGAIELGRKNRRAYFKLINSNIKEFRYLINAKESLMYFKEGHFSLVLKEGPLKATVKDYDSFNYWADKLLMIFL